MLNAEEQTRPVVLPNFCVVGIDETHNWAEGFKEEHGIKTVTGFYLFDLNERTYICSLTPSYFGLFLTSQAELVEGLEPYEEMNTWGETRIQLVEDEIRDAEAGGELGDYFSNIDESQIADRYPLGYNLAKAYLKGEVTKDEIREDVLEYYRSNGYA